MIHYRNSSVDVSVASINRLKSMSVKVAFAVSKSKNVSNGDRFSDDGNAVKPVKRAKFYVNYNSMKSVLN